MKLNLKKYAFGVKASKFINYLVTQRGTKAFFKTKKEVQRLKERVVDLKRLISICSNKCQPFFKTLKRATRFE